MTEDIKTRLLAFAETKSGKGIQFITDKSLVADLKSLFSVDFFFMTRQLTIKKMAALVLIDFKEPVCEHCGNTVSHKFPWKSQWTTSDRITPYGSWSRTCSQSCSQHITEKEGKRAATMLERHGVLNIMKKPGFAKAAMINRKTDWISVGLAQQERRLLKRGVSEEFIKSIDFSDPESKVNAIIKCDRFKCITF